MRMTLIALLVPFVAACSEGTATDDDALVEAVPTPEAAAAAAASEITDESADEALEKLKQELELEEADAGG